MAETVPGRKGFTLLEILVVIIIVGVLAAVAMPLLSRNIERARATEAVTALGAIRRAMDECKLANNGTYAGCDFRLYIDNPLSQPGSHFYMAGYVGVSSTGYLVAAGRNSLELAVPVDIPGSLTCNGTTFNASDSFIGLCQQATGLSIVGRGIYDGMRW